MAKEDDSLAARHLREDWRRKWIDNFRERQRTARRWIEFVEIAKWCAQLTTGRNVEGEQEAFALAYQRLANSVLEREFEVGGLSKLLYLYRLCTISPSCTKSPDPAQKRHHTPNTLYIFPRFMHHPLRGLAV